MNIGNEIRKLAFENGVTLTYLAKCIAEKRVKLSLYKIYQPNLKKAQLTLMN